MEHAGKSMTKLASFERHKTVLLHNLRGIYERGPKTEPFDADKAWDSLTRIADEYLRVVQVRGDRVPVAVRVKRLEQIAKALGRARVLLDKAKQDTVRNDLIRGWCAEAKILPGSVITKDGSPLALVYDEVAGMPARVKKLEMAARRAAKDMHTTRGRPKGKVVLPGECVRALAKVYRASTGVKPGKSDGPFARFVYAFLAVTGQRVLAYRSVVDVIKNTHF
jgi:hypothetical protein